MFNIFAIIWSWVKQLYTTVIEKLGFGEADPGDSGIGFDEDDPGISGIDGAGSHGEDSRQRS